MVRRADTFLGQLREAALPPLPYPGKMNAPVGFPWEQFLCCDSDVNIFISHMVLIVKMYLSDIITVACIYQAFVC